VIGLIQSVLTPETAKIFCEGLDVVPALAQGNEKATNPLAAEHKLRGSEAFYHSFRDVRLGLVF
jgi:hypothetical protein